jgi:type I restriction enzyme R subunit
VNINQTPEQVARDQIDARLIEAGWHVQEKNAINLSAGLGIAIREYQTEVGPADYVLFVDRRAVGVIEAKPKDWGHKITTVEDQSASYAAAKLKWVKNKASLPFIYESTGVITRSPTSAIPSLALGRCLRSIGPRRWPNGYPSRNPCERVCTIFPC